MAIGDLTRIRTNVQAMHSLGQMQKTNSQLGVRQMRLATGSRLNRAEDDSAGYTIAKKLEAKVRGQAQALANIGDAKSMLTVAEGSLNSVMDILQTLKEKAIQADNDTMGTDERDAIETQMAQLTEEIHEILADTEFNGTSLFSSGASGVTLNFHVGAESDETFTADIGQIAVSTATSSTGNIFAGAASALTNASAGSVTWDLDTNANAQAAIEGVGNAISVISKRLSGIGDSQKRLSFKQENLQAIMTNYESARSQIADADFAKEQMEIVKLQILQQTGTASLAQANAGPQSVLSLF